MRNGIELTGIVLFSVASVLPVVAAIHHAFRLVTEWHDGAARGTLARRLVWSVAGAACVYVIVAVDALWLEPNWPYVESRDFRGAVDKPLRILHLSDLHVGTGFPARERWLIRELPILKPDLILITGDIHQITNRDVGSLRRVLEPLQAPLGVFACCGWDDVGVLQQAAPRIRFLSNAACILPWGKGTVGLCGIDPIRGLEEAYQAVQVAPFRIAMHHAPDLAEDAAAHGINLYLCGHTHGGQVRIPFWGAIVTNAETAKRFEDGFYMLGNMLLHTSRGLGVEGFARDVRFLCRPEITMITVRP